MDIHVRKLAAGLVLVIVISRAQMLVLNYVQELVRLHVTVALELVLKLVIINVKVLVITHVLKDVLADAQKLVWDYVPLLVV